MEALQELVAALALTSLTDGQTGLSGSFVTSIIDIHDYTNTSKLKTTKCLTAFDTNGGSNSSWIAHNSTLWNNTAAINQIRVRMNSNSFNQYTQATLYGIKGQPMSTRTPIATQTLSSSASSVTFSSIPQNYADLVVVIDGIASTEASDIMRFNNDAGSNYSFTVLEGTPASSKGTNQTSAYLGNTNTTRYLKVINIFNYSNSSTYKTLISRSNYQAGTYAVSAWVSLWRNTSPITQLVVGPNSGTMSAGTTVSVYGIAAGNLSAKAEGGNTVVTDGTYWYHTFTSSGTFTPSSALSADVLVIAGGGGGGSYAGGGGGGGAGGVIYFANQSLTTSVYTATVGAGGGADTNGSNSVFGVLTAGVGGGKGGTGSTGFSGGSGGGGSDGAGGSSTQTGTGATSYYGNAGGTGTGAGTTGGGGGGGAGGAGDDVSG